MDSANINSVIIRVKKLSLDDQSIKNVSNRDIFDKVRKESKRKDNYDINNDYEYSYDINNNLRFCKKQKCNQISVEITKVKVESSDILIKSIDKLLRKVLKRKKYITMSYFNNELINYIGYLPIYINNSTVNSRYINMCLLYLYLIKGNVELLEIDKLDKYSIINVINNIFNIYDVDIYTVEVLYVMKNVHIFLIFINKKINLCVDKYLWRQYINLFSIKNVIDDNYIDCIINHPGSVDYFRIDNKIHEKNIRLTYYHTNIDVSFTDLYKILSKLKFYYKG
jgi:hypothetical protein